MKNLLTHILQKETVLAVGCTEPAAMALLAARVRKIVPGAIQSINVRLSPSVFKNAKAVGIPGVKEKGIAIAFLLGLSIEEPTYNLEILSSSREGDKKRALELMDKVPVDIQIHESETGLFLEMELITEEGRGKGQTRDYHSQLVFLQKDDDLILRKKREVNPKEEDPLLQYTLREILACALTIPPQNLLFLLKGKEINLEMALAGLTLKEGLGLGISWGRLMEKGFLQDDLLNQIALYTSAACDARMCGLLLPVMTISGSGNHGLIAFIPISLAAHHFKSPKSQLLHALALSCLTTIYMKRYTGRLSSICGCALAAGVGAGIGLTYLLESTEMEEAGKIIISTLAGMICDGGKVSCALKLCTSATTAYRGALLASEGLMVPADNGIVGKDLQETINNLEIICKKGMKGMDQTILSIL